MRRQIKAVLLVAMLAATGVALTACETMKDAWEGVRDRRRLGIVMRRGGWLAGPAAPGRFGPSCRFSPPRERASAPERWRSAPSGPSGPRLEIRHGLVVPPRTRPRPPRGW